MKRLKDNRAVPEARRGTLPKTFSSSKRKTKLHSTRLRKSGSRLRQQNSMHMVSNRDHNSAELETVRTSRSPTTVMTANGEVQTREEATVHVKELDLFVTVMFQEETPAVLSLGKPCEDHGFSYHWTSGQKTHLTKKGKRIDCNISNCVRVVVPGFIDEFLHNAHTYFSIIFIKGFRI